MQCKVTAGQMQKQKMEKKKRDTVNSMLYMYALVHWYGLIGIYYVYFANIEIWQLVNGILLNDVRFV